MLKYVGGEFNMKNFSNIEEIVAHMFEEVSEDRPVSIVANKDLAVEIMKELLTFESIILDFCDIDTFNYDKEYVVTLDDGEDADCYHISVDPIYSCEKRVYWALNGYVLFHEDANSKAFIDMQNNEYINPSKCDWFVIGEIEANSDLSNSEDDDTVFKECAIKSDDNFTIAVDLKTHEVEKTFENIENRVKHIQSMLEEIRQVFS